MNISQENFLTTDSQRCTRQQEPEMNTTNGMDVGLKIQVQQPWIKSSCKPLPGAIVERLYEPYTPIIAI